MNYRCEATSITGFVQQLAVAYLAHGYWFFVAGRIPSGKDPTAIDAKLLARYDVACSRWARTRRKQAGLANVQYLRCGRDFVLLATHGQHRLFEDEAACLRDARRSPIRFAGYAISHRGGHPHVRIDLEVYRDLKRRLVARALLRTSDHLVADFQALPFEPYAPVRRQLLNLLRAVNKRRKLAALPPVPIEAIRLRRRIVKPFGP